MKIENLNGKSNDMYQFDKTTIVNVGIVIMTDDDIFNDYMLIIDDDNCLWYSDRSFEEVKANQFICFRKGENNKALEISIIPYNLHYNGSIPKYFLIKDIRDGNVKGIPYKDILTIDTEYDTVASSSWGWYEKFSFIALNYISNNVNILNRYFICDESTKTYRELSGAIASFYESSIYSIKSESDILPFNLDLAVSINDIVNNFNPYEIFESYRVEIDYYHQSRVGKDDYFFEYKKYSIKYFDEYLSRWFKNEKIELNRECGYTSHFEPSIPYERFYGEEVAAKRKAYAEYSKLEHYDCLMQSIYQSIKKHYLNIYSGEFVYNRTMWIPDDLDEIRIKDVYYWIYETISRPLSNIYFVRPSFGQTQAERYEEILIDSINRFNNSSIEVFKSKSDNV